MGMRIKRVEEGYGIWSGGMSEFLNLTYNHISKESVDNYIETSGNKFPESESYSLDDLCYDVSQGEGDMVNGDWTYEQAEWIEEMLDVVGY